MKYLTVLIAIGIIGIIGTVEYSHAQTILTIPEPDNFPSNTIKSDIEIKSDQSSKHYLSAHTDNISTIPNNTGAYFFPPDVFLETHPLFPPTPEQSLCLMQVINIYKNTFNTNHVPNLSVPDNIPDTKDTINAIGMNVKSSCKISLEANLTTPILTKKELRITLYNQSEKKSYFFAPAENITQAQPTPLCTTTNFNTETQTLKGDTKMCYGKNGNDMIIITKRLLGFYGATEKILTAEETTKKVNNEQAYLELLKRLYLPAV